MLDGPVLPDVCAKTSNGQTPARDHVWPIGVVIDSTWLTHAIGQRFSFKTNRHPMSTWFQIPNEVLSCINSFWFATDATCNWVCFCLVLKSSLVLRAMWCNLWSVFVHLFQFTSNNTVGTVFQTCSLYILLKFMLVEILNVKSYSTDMAWSFKRNSVLNLPVLTNFRPDI